MAFNGYLTNQEIGELAQAALVGGLLDVPRQVLLAGIPAAFAAAMAHTDSPLDQFTLDLVRVNAVERMAGGEIPVLILLRNSADRLRLLDRQEAAVFDRALSRAKRAAAGVPQPANPAQPPQVSGNERVVGTADTVGTPPVAPSGAPIAREQLAKVLAFNAAVIGVVTAIYGTVSPYARTLSGKIWFTLGASAAFLLISITIVLLYNIGKKYGSRKLSVSVGVMVAAIIAILAVGGGATYLIWHARPSAAAKTPAPSTSGTLPTTSSVRGTITSPGSGPVDIAPYSTLHASGTARNVERGHSLWLFLHVDCNGLYYPSDPGSLKLAHGRWSGSVFVGGCGPGRFTLWLADLGPQGLAKLGIGIPGQSPGFATLQFAPDVTPLDSVPFTVP